MKKVLTGLVAFVTVFSMLVGLRTTAFADTAVTTTTTTTTVATPFVFTRDLTIGSTGADVVALQTLLVAQGYLVMPVGVPMGYFGTLTQSALAKYQAANGISPAAGYFGPITKAYVAAHSSPVGTFPPGCTSSTGFSTTTGAACSTTTTLPAGCTSTVGFSPTTGVKCDSTTGGTTGGTTGTLSGGETSINNFDISDADDSTLEEDDTKVDVAQVQFDVDDGDAQLDRADFIFDGTGDDEDKPWNVFDKVYLLDDNHDVIDSIDSSDKEAWDETATNDVYRIRFTDVGQIFKEGTNNATLYVAVDVASSVDGSDSNDADWSVQVATDPGDENGLRFVDSEDINTEVGSDDTADFSIEASGATSEFTVTEDSDSPDSDTLEVKETATTEETLAIFKMEADQDGGDVKLDDFPVDITIDNAGAPTSTFDDVIDNVYVTIDGTKYDGEYVAGSCGATLNDCTDGETASFTFNDIEDDDIVINAGDDQTAEVSVKFKSQGNNQVNYANGTTITASANLTSNDVEDADSGDDIGDLSGDADGEEFTLASTGLGVTLVSTDETTSGDNDTIGQYTFVVDVTAFGDDQWVELSGTRGTAESNTGFNYQILDGSNGVVSTGTTTFAATADKDDDGSNRVRIDKNETVRFTVDVFFDASVSSSYKASLYAIDFAQSNADATDQQVLSPDSTYRTGTEFINAS